MKGLNIHILQEHICSVLVTQVFMSQHCTPIQYGIVKNVVKRIKLGTHF
jgi:hypothetical protein